MRIICAVRLDYAEVDHMAFVTCCCYVWKLVHNTKIFLNTTCCCYVWKLFPQLQTLTEHESQEKQQLQQLYRLRKQESKKHNSMQSCEEDQPEVKSAHDCNWATFCLVREHGQRARMLLLSTPCSKCRVWLVKRRPPWRRTKACALCASALSLNSRPAKVNLQ